MEAIARIQIEADANDSETSQLWICRDYAGLFIVAKIGFC